ncbi:MAG TPA: hypothetical protein VJS92_03625 [Candidatus Polarisedimenticolaceae bacterium]|nr:hypothetical protein [Candidatus Polarisedimenticolaceae bacterium]
MVRGGMALGCLAAVLAAGVPQVQGAGKTVDLDGRTANGQESRVDLTVLTTFPVKIENKITNKAIGDAFTFTWASAGPGGFSSSLVAGTTAGVGTKWTWQTSQTVYAFTGTACGSDVCFTKTAGPDPVTTRGPFTVPGRSLLASGVTLSNASLTSSLITFFSPPQTIVSVTSSIAPVAPGVLGFTTSATNNTAQTLNFQIAAVPTGCCPEPHQLNCEGTCVDYLKDPDNCGACGNKCANGVNCVGGTCEVEGCPSGEVLCGEVCTDLKKDEHNCGACGHDCDDSCPYPGVNKCFGGGCECGSGLAAGDAAGAADEPLGGVIEAPLCETPGAAFTVPPGATISQCQAAPLLAKEVLSQLTVCGTTVPDGEAQCAGGEPASQGPFIQLVPDVTRGFNTFLSPAGVFVRDASGDGLLQNGECGMVQIPISNIGVAPLSGLMATFSSPPVDLTDDGATNPQSVTITPVVSAYPNLAGFVGGTGNCNLPTVLPTAANAMQFQVCVPLDHPGDVSRPFNLAFTGTIGATHAPFTQNVPVTLGIASRCDAASPTGSFDGIDGLASPMAALVPDGDPNVPFPSQTFQSGKTRPLKLRVLCGGLALSTALVADPPAIVGLREETRGALPLTGINADQPNPDSPLFRANGQQWIFNLRTEGIGRGTFFLTIRVGGRDFVTGFRLTGGRDREASGIALPDSRTGPRELTQR